jgi:hypothetical protein
MLQSVLVQNSFTLKDMYCEVWLFTDSVKNKVVSAVGKCRE